MHIWAVSVACVLACCVCMQLSRPCLFFSSFLRWVPREVLAMSVVCMASRQAGAFTDASFKRFTTGFLLSPPSSPLHNALSCILVLTGGEREKALSDCYCFLQNTGLIIFLDKGSLRIIFFVAFQICEIAAGAFHPCCVPTRKTGGKRHTRDMSDSLN